MMPIYTRNFVFIEQIVLFIFYVFYGCTLTRKSCRYIAKLMNVNFKKLDDMEKNVIQL